MSNPYKNVHPYMVECAAEAARVAGGVTAAQLAEPGPTHCPDWDLRTLVNHWVLYTSHGLEHRALREHSSPRADRPRLHGGSRLGAGVRRAARSRRGRLGRPAVWEGEVDLGMAKMPAADIASMIVKEMAVHGWDVATATGQEFRISDGAARFVLDVVDTHADLYRQYDGFADPVPVADDAPLFDRALAHSGRDPRLSAEQRSGT